MTPRLQRPANCEAEAWEETFECTYPVAYATAKYHLGSDSQSECEDIDMEALGRLHKKIGELESEDELKPLVCAIA